MKSIRRASLPILSTCILTVMLFTSILGCTKSNPQQPTPTTTETQENTYKILNPQGVPMPVTVYPLARRLDSLNNKTIYVVFYEPKQIIGDALAAKLKADYPKTDWRFITGTTFGAYTPEDEVLNDADAIIRGNAW